MEWYELNNAHQVDSPALLVYTSRVNANIDAAIRMTGDPMRLMPHGKTHKSEQGFTAMIRRGIRRFKCATIQECAITARVGASQVLLSYQPVGPKIARFIELIDSFPSASFACLVDNVQAIEPLSRELQRKKIVLPVYIDINTGMNRTGITVSRAMELLHAIIDTKELRFEGLHAYDGHIKEPDPLKRKQLSDASISEVLQLRAQIESDLKKRVEFICGGSPTFPVHAGYPDRVCSPGTFIFWDRGYQVSCPEQPFVVAAVLLCRVISIPTENTITVDLGHKSVAAENEITRRVYFPADPDLKAISQSEEHLVLERSGKSYQLGDVLYGIPYHICPTVALYDKMTIVEEGVGKGDWIITRSR